MPAHTFSGRRAIGLARALQAQHRDGDDGQPEHPRGHPHRVDSAQGGDQQAADAGADDVGQVEHRLVDAVGVVQRPPGAGGRLGQHRLAGRHPGGVEDTRRARPGRQHRDVDGVHAEGQRDHRDRGHRQRGERIGDHRDPAAADVVDGGTGDHGGRQQRQGPGHRHDRCVERRPVALQHQPRERDDGDAVAGAGHQRGEQDQNRPVRACCWSWGIAAESNSGPGPVGDGLFRACTVDRVNWPIRAPAGCSSRRCHPARLARRPGDAAPPRWRPTPARSRDGRGGAHRRGARRARCRCAGPARGWWSGARRWRSSSGGRSPTSRTGAGRCRVGGRRGRGC